jgi:SHS2 domain-containing protein
MAGESRFEYLEHTADIKIRAFGQSVEEAFLNAALAATNFISDVSKIEKTVVKKINVSSSRLDTLLYDFLEELLVLIDTDGFLLSGAKKLEIKQENEGGEIVYKLHCIAEGDHYSKYERKGDLKAITYSEMSILQKNDGFEITVVYDI